MNSVNLVGRICNDLELKSTESGKNFCSVCLAVNKRVNGETKADFIDCVAWGNTATLITKYLNKGDLIGFSGSLTTNTYTDKDGKKRKNTSVLISDITFCNNKGGRAEEPEEAPKKVSRAKVEEPEEADEEPEEADEDDLPF